MMLVHVVSAFSRYHQVVSLLYVICLEAIYHWTTFALDVLGFTLLQGDRGEACMKIAITYHIDRR